jgi:hypothetical protein
MFDLGLTTLSLKPSTEIKVIDSSSDIRFEDKASVLIDDIRCWDLTNDVLKFTDEYVESKQYTHFYWVKLKDGDQYGLNTTSRCLHIPNNHETPRSRWLCLCVVHDGKKTTFYRGGISEEIMKYDLPMNACSKDIAKSIGPIGHLAQLLCWPYVLTVEKLELIRKATHLISPRETRSKQTDMFVHTNNVIESASINMSPPEGIDYKGVPVWNNNKPIPIPQYKESDVYTHLYWFVKVGKSRRRVGITHKYDSCMYVEEDGTIGVFSRRNGLFRPTRHKLMSDDWICLVAIGRGNQEGGGKTKFFVGSRSSKFSYVGHADRTCSGDSSNTIGMKGKGLGIVARVMVWSRALSQDELDIVRVSTSQRFPPETDQSFNDAQQITPYVGIATAIGAAIYATSVFSFN